MFYNYFLNKLTFIFYFTKKERFDKSMCVIYYKDYGTIYKSTKLNHQLTFPIRLMNGTPLIKLYITRTLQLLSLSVKLVRFIKNFIIFL